MSTLPDILTQAGPYTITWIGAADENQFPFRDGLPIEGVVCHIMDGTLVGCDSWFNNPASQASTNFGISKTGEIHQYVALQSRAPYANGVRDEPKYTKVMNQQVLALSRTYWPQSQNKWTWSIEHEGRSGEQITDFPAMFEASTWLSATLLASLPPEQQRTWGHYQFDGVNRPRCPGWSSSTWNAYDGRVMQVLEEMAAPPTPPSSDYVELKRLMDEGYNAAFAAMNQSAAAFAKWEELFAEARRRGLPV